MSLHDVWKRLASIFWLPLNQQVPPRSYPRRWAPSWTVHFVRQLHVKKAVADVGTLGLAVLIEFVLEEDRLKCLSAPQLSQAEIADRLHCTIPAVASAIQKCIDTGWLHFEQSTAQRPWLAWVTIPASESEVA